MDRFESKEKLALVPVLLCVGAALAWRVASNWSFTTDDAYVTLRYAKNLAAGFGPTWNPGGAPVEGYSNFSFVLLGAMGERLGLDSVLLLKLVGLLGLLGTLVALYRIGRIWLSPLASAIAPTLLLTQYGAVFWATSGLETAAFQGLLAASFALFLVGLYGGEGGAARVPPRRTMVACAAVLALASLTRIEAPFVLGIFCALLAAEAWRRRARRDALFRVGLWLVLPVCALLAVQYLWKWSYYGALLPNSYACKLHAKGGGDGLRIVARFALIAWFPALVSAFAPRRVRLPVFALAIPTAIYLALLWGADPMIAHHNRLALPAWGLLLVGASIAGMELLSSSPPGTRPWIAPALLAIALLALVESTPRHVRRLGRYSQRYAERQRMREEIAEWMKARGGEKVSYVVGDAGLISYVAGGISHDSYCLNDPVMARTPGGRDPRRYADRVFEELRPRFLVLSSRNAEFFVGRDRISDHLVAHPGIELYALERVERTEAEDAFYYWIYQRRRADREDARR